MRKHRINLLNVIILTLFVLSYTGSHAVFVYAEPADDSVTVERSVEDDNPDPAGGTISAAGTDSTAGASADDAASADETDTAPVEVSDEMTVTYEAMNEGEPAQIADTGIPAINLVIDPAEYQAMINSEDHSYRAQNCSLQITVPEDWESEYGPGDTSIYSKDVPLEYIRGRGNSTWIEDKKPFKLKLSKKTDLFGMGKNKHWVLIANAMDPTLLKDKITSYISSRLGMPYTAEFVPVDFYVNGECQGSYFLAEQIRLDENRVDLDVLTSSDLSEPEITGGYLIALNPYDYEHANNKFTTQKGIEFFLHTPSFGGSDPEETYGPEEQRNYITDYLQKVENAIYAEDFTDEDGIRYSDYMDLESAAKYWWVQEFSCNSDGFITPSTYLYKERSGKLHWGPLWDFDLAYDSPMMDSGDLNNMHMEWLEYMRAYDPQYQEILRSVWDELDQILQDITCEGGILDQYRDELRASAAQDSALWGKDDTTTFEEAVKQLRDKIDKRRSGINSTIDTDLTKVYVTASFEADGELVLTENVRVGNRFPEEELPEAPDREGFYFANWVTKDSGEPISNVQILDDMVFVPEYIPYEEAIEPKEIYFDQGEVWVDLNEKTYTPKWSIAPLDATSRQVAWSSSDPQVAETSTNGKIKLCDPGTAIIKAELKNGISNKLTLHVYDPEQENIPPVESLTLPSDQLTLKPDEYGQIQPKLSPYAAGFSLGFNSRDEYVAAVDESGMVHALTPGTCTIKVVEYNTGLSAEYTVTVVDNSDEITQAKNELAEKIISAKRDISAGNYTEESLAALNAAIDEANGAIDDRTATESRIMIAQTKLLRAWRRLVPSDDSGTDDKSAAELASRHDAVDALAETLISMYDTNFDTYKSADVAALKALLAKGDQVLADPDADTAALREARTNILLACKNLKKKSANTLTVKGRTIKVKGKKSGTKKVLKKTKKIKKTKAFKISNAVGDVTFKKLSGNKKIKVSKAGKVTLKKGLKKGTYKVKVRVTASGNGDYMSAAKDVTFKVKVK